MAFGQTIAEARKKAGLSQKALAARIKKEDGSPISPQYLNDLEWDRRNSPSPHFLHQLAAELHLPEEYLVVMAKQYPEDLHDGPHPPETVQAAFRAFRKELKGR
jgi:transcriptional regulator with XRE-family HTH domain